MQYYADWQLLFASIIKLLTQNTSSHKLFRKMHHQTGLQMEFSYRKIRKEAITLPTSRKAGFFYFTKRRLLIAKQQPCSRFRESERAPKMGNTEPIKRLFAQTARLFSHEEVGKGIRQVTLFFIFILAMFQHSWFLELYVKSSVLQEQSR